MGWFKDWLMKPEQVTIYPLEVTLAPKPPHKSISEPVVTLLKMLEDDKWEPIEDRDWYSRARADSQWYKLVRVFDESIVIECSKYISYSHIGHEHTSYTVYYLDWMTSDEAMVVAQAIEACWLKTSRLNVANRQTIQRAAFANKIGVQNELDGQSF